MLESFSGPLGNDLLFFTVMVCADLATTINLSLPVMESLGSAKKQQSEYSTIASRSLNLVLLTLSVFSMLL